LPSLCDIKSDSMLWLQLANIKSTEDTSNSNYFFTMQQQPPPPVGQSPLITEASRSHSDTSQSVGLLWTSNRPIAETSTWQNTTLTRYIDTIVGIRTRNPSKRVAADLRLRPRRHRNRQFRLQPYWIPIHPIHIFSQLCLYFGLVIRLIQMFINKHNNNNKHNSGRNNITCNTNCKYRTAATLYTL